MRLTQRCTRVAIIAFTLAISFAAFAPGSAQAATKPTPVLQGQGGVAAGQVVHSPTAGGCTVTVNGQDKNGRWDEGTSWCCVATGSGNETCYNCDFHTCRSTPAISTGGMDPAETQAM